MVLMFQLKVLSFVIRDSRTTLYHFMTSYYKLG